MTDALVRDVDATRARKERVHGTMLVELLVMLIFLALAFAFVQKDEMKTSVLQARVTHLTDELAKANKNIIQLQRSNEELVRINRELRVSLARWMDRPRKALPASEQPIVVPQHTISDFKNKVANLTDLLNELARENAKYRKQLGSKNGGHDLPNCLVSPGYLLTITFLADGNFGVTPHWTERADAAARGVPGVAALVAASDQSPIRFGQKAALARAWGRSQLTPCGFRALVEERHSNLALYKKQLRTVEQFFYVKRN